MQIRIEVPFSPNLQRIFEEDKPEGVSIHIPPTIHQRDFGSISWAEVIITTAIGVPAGLLVNYISGKLKGRRAPRRIYSRRTELTTLTDEGLTRFIEEEKIEEEKDERHNHD